MNDKDIKNTDVAQITANDTKAKGDSTIGQDKAASLTHEAVKNKVASDAIISEELKIQEEILSPLAKNTLSQDTLPKDILAQTPLAQAPLAQDPLAQDILGHSLLAHDPQEQTPLSQLQTPLAHDSQDKAPLSQVVQEAVLLIEEGVSEDKLRDFQNAQPLFNAFQRDVEKSLSKNQAGVFFEGVDRNLLNKHEPEYELDEDDAESDHPADIAEKIEGLELDEQVSYVLQLPVEQAAEALVEMEEQTRAELLENLDNCTVAGLVGEMSPDDAADILDEMEEDRANALLGHLTTDDANEIRTLMAFDPDTAGGLMNTEIVILHASLNVDESISVLRHDIEDKEIPYYGYIVDSNEKLAGVLSLRDLLTAPKGTMLADAIKGQNIISVTYDEDRNEVARLFGDYNFMALPVVDYEGRLLGVITHDDVIDIINDLASEDMLGMVGAGVDETTETPWKSSVWMRFPWLLINMVNSSASAFVVYLFDGSIATMPILAVLMPMVANQAGNTGQQALAVIIRQLALDKMEKDEAIRAVFREAKISICNGLMLSALIWFGVYLLSGTAALATVMVSALIMDMIIGAVAGASIPLILKRLGRDPAQASSIFLTAFTDGAGFFIFLGLATVFLL